MMVEDGNIEVLNFVLNSSKIALVKFYNFNSEIDMLEETYLELSAKTELFAAATMIILSGMETKEKEV